MDQALQDAGSYEEFLENLSSMGYIELPGRKRLSVQGTQVGRGRPNPLLGERYRNGRLWQRLDAFNPEAMERRYR